MAFFVANIRKVPEFHEAGVPFTLKSQCPVIAGFASGEIKPSGFGCIFVTARAKMEDWPLARLARVNGTGGFAYFCCTYAKHFHGFLSFQIIHFRLAYSPFL